MFGRIFRFRKPSSGFDNDLRPDGFPIYQSRIFFREYLERFTLYSDRIAVGLDLLFKIPHYRIVFEEVRKRFRIREVVYSNEIDVRVAERGTHHVAADPAK